ncbi:AarF/ABC1/UbiB kinase family protein [Cyanobium sp. HWJ4-Hawea]|uniref:ABC1 kinase family protein n=1 Tax=Cyanobium sp. HWJ4-Hawea TaxID=2823713 RepID=UPI0020CF730F|nr:AarF/ABC1/UbiB kinase family protein [Cyanobium sp. HWJ4-Hawea]MCP9810000.1 AarF/ABC1/UbiB kinase family protein [Cyanobium sp. HWJ4-Hawea]
MGSYSPGKDLRWLLLRPWVLVSRLVVVLWQLTSLALVLVAQANSQSPDVQKRLAKRILTTLTGLGPCFIKVGQSLSTRPDLVRRDWLEQLTQLQDNLPAFPHAIALATIEAELGAPADQLFESFPDYPVAAASLGQVYKAQLADGHWVAVKVQRPNLPYTLRRDLVIIRILAITVAPLLPLNLGFGLGDIIDEFGRSLFEEIDYHQEADNAERFAALFANQPEVTVPRVERLLSSGRVLTTSWINGTKLQERQALEAHQLDPTALIRTGVIAGLQQLLEFGYFHADPHPGNLFALPGRTGVLGHVAYVDFGMMDSISDSDRLTLTGAVVHLINRDFRDLALDFVKLGFLNPKADLEPIIPALEEVLGGALGENVGAFNFKAITDRFSELMYAYPFRVPARFALIIRAVVSQEGLALRLDPSFKIIRVAYPYVARRLLAGDTAEMREKLLEVIFDANGRLRLERLENLLSVVENDSANPDLLPVAGAGLKLLLGKGGSSLRQRLLLNLVQDDRLQTEDLRALASLLRRTFSPRKLVGGVLRQLNPMAA